MKGIYLFKNNINNKVYIGKSQDLETRYKSHKRNYNNIKLNDYNTKFYRALRKYGFENFSYTILESSNFFSENDLNEKEKYYIKIYDSVNNGYNIQLGGNDTAVPRKLNKAQILEIKDLLKNMNNSFKDIAIKYSVSESLISMINSGKIWNMIGDYSYPIRIDTNCHQGQSNPKAKISDKQVLELRKYYVNHPLEEVYKKFGACHSFSEIKKICYGVQFTHLPIYKKRQKQWILNNICIDYPREVE